VIDLPAWNGSLLLSVDAVKFSASAFRAFLGGEFNFSDNLFLRIGQQTGDGAKSFSAGIGFRSDRYRLDYGFIPFQSDLGNSHKFSIGLNL
jgi:hypothetical protein